MGTSQAAKAASHDRILDIAAALIRRDGVDSLSVAELMKEAGLTHGGFYRHFDSREHLVSEAAQRALSQQELPRPARHRHSEERHRQHVDELRVAERGHRPLRQPRAHKRE